MCLANNYTRSQYTEHFIIFYTEHFKFTVAFYVALHAPNL